MKYVFGPVPSRRLGHIPVDPRFAVLCDKGMIEEYNSETFEEIAEKVIRIVS